MAYAGLIAFFYASPQIGIFNFQLTPEAALVFGNIFSFIINPKIRFLLKLKDKKVLSSGQFAFSFTGPKKISFIPGQYLEWTLPHKNTDNRGIRRYFSIASSPKEKDLMIMIKIPKNASSFKRNLSNMPKGKLIIASRLAGDFVLPDDAAVPLVFIAGGVGVAPFRSMIQNMIDKKETRDIVMLYIDHTKDDFVFSNVWGKAILLGLKTIYIPTKIRGRLNSSDIINIPDYKNRCFYISGPQLMVKETKKMIENLNIKKTRIVTDYFPGY